MIAANEQEKEETTMATQKTLIVYYSRTGNTRAVAELIQAKIGSELVQLKTTTARPKNYRAEVDLNQAEQENNVLPELETKIRNFANHNRIFIGTPTWNMALPQAVVSFLKEHDFADKTVIPFNTNGGYGAGSVFTQIKREAKGAAVLRGYSVKGGEEISGRLLVIKGNKKVAVAQEVDHWLSAINFK